MASTKIAIINASTVLTDEQVGTVVPALQTQVTRDLGPAWGVSADLQFVTKAQKSPVGVWQIVVLDDSDQAGALGYHDMTPEGLPMGKVFAKSDLAAGTSWTVTLSHETEECLVDPWINYTVLDGNILYALEVSDACEADQYAYDIDSVKVSDFVLPSWFEPGRPPGTQFDFMGHISRPFQILAGGYIGYMDITSNQGWQQMTADRVPLRYDMRARPGSRRERRRTPRNQWMISKI